MLIFDRIGSTLLFGFAANVDNVSLGLAYGLKRRRIRWEQNLLVAVVTTVITLVALAAGRQIRDLLPPSIPNMLGGVLLVCLAAWSVFWERAGADDRRTETIGRFARPNSVGVGESLFLAGTLSINNIGLAIAGGIGGIGYASAGASIFCFSMVMLALGHALGLNATRLRLPRQVLRSSLSGNVVLALAGILMVIGY